MSTADSSASVPSLAAHPVVAVAMGSPGFDEQRRLDAHRALRAALSCVFRALGTGCCSRYLGPIVPGATMPGGARVPGTSFELDPVQAAFNVALLLHCRESAAAAGDAGIPALLTVADWRARRALMEGREPIRVGALLEYLLLAQDFERGLPPGLAPGPRLQQASAAAVGALLGSGKLEIPRAVGARPGADDGVTGASTDDATHGTTDGTTDGVTDGARRVGASAGNAARRLASALALADATGRGVQHALFALKHDSRSGTDIAFPRPTRRADAGPVWAAAPVGSVGPVGPVAWVGPVASVGPLGKLASVGPVGKVGPLTQVADDFAASLDGCFPPKQVKAILNRFADPVGLEACPVNALVALLVTN